MQIDREELVEELLRNDFVKKDVLAWVAEQLGMDFDKSTKILLSKIYDPTAASMRQYITYDLVTKKTHRMVALHGKCQKGVDRTLPHLRDQILEEIKRYQETFKSIRDRGYFDIDDLSEELWHEIRKYKAEVAADEILENISNKGLYGENYMGRLRSLFSEATTQADLRKIADLIESIPDEIFFEKYIHYCISSLKQLRLSVRTSRVRLPACYHKSSFMSTTVRPDSLKDIKNLTGDYWPMYNSIWNSFLVKTVSGQFVDEDALIETLSGKDPDKFEMFTVWNNSLSSQREFRRYKGRIFVIIREKNTAMTRENFERECYKIMRGRYE